MSRMPWDRAEIGTHDTGLDAVAARLERHADAMAQPAPLGLVDRIQAALDDEPLPARGWLRGGGWFAGRQAPMRMMATAGVLVIGVVAGLALGQLTGSGQNSGGAPTPPAVTTPSPTAFPTQSPSPSPSASPSTSPSPVSSARLTTPRPSATSGAVIPRPSASDDDDNSGPGGGDNDDSDGDNSGSGGGGGDNSGSGGGGGDNSGSGGGGGD